jgi:hypothetical protein
MDPPVDPLCGIGALVADESPAMEGSAARVPDPTPDESVKAAPLLAMGPLDDENIPSFWAVSSLSGWNLRPESALGPVSGSCFPAGAGLPPGTRFSPGKATQPPRMTQRAAPRK